MATKSVEKRQKKLLADTIKMVNSPLYRAAEADDTRASTIVKWMRDPAFAELTKAIKEGGLFDESKHSYDQPPRSGDGQQQPRRAPEPQPEPLRDLTEEEIAALPYLPEIPIPE